MEQKIAAVLFVALGAFTVDYALGLRMYTRDGPGAGLFPLIIGAGLVLAGTLWFLQLALVRASKATQRTAWLRIGLQVAALLAFSFMLQPAGFAASAAVLVAATALIAGERNWAAIAVVAALCSFGLQALFGLLGTRL